MVRVYIPTYIKKLNTSRETRRRLATLARGAAWMTPEEKDICAQFLHTVLGNYAQSQTFVAPLHVHR